MKNLYEQAPPIYTPSALRSFETKDFYISNLWMSGKRSGSTDRSVIFEITSRSLGNSFRVSVVNAEYSNHEVGLEAVHDKAVVGFTGLAPKKHMGNEYFLAEEILLNGNRKIYASPHPFPADAKLSVDREKNMNRMANSAVVAGSSALMLNEELCREESQWIMVASDQAHLTLMLRSKDDYRYFLFIEKKFAQEAQIDYIEAGDQKMMANIFLMQKKGRLNVQQVSGIDNIARLTLQK